MPIVGLLRSVNLKVQESAVIGLRNLSTDPENEEAIVRESALVPLFALLRSPHEIIYEHASIVLRHLSINAQNKVKFV